MEPIDERESSSVMDQAGGVGRIRLDSGAEPPLNKPIRSYMDESLPDLLRSGSPLRRRVSSPVSDTLKQMRKEVDLTRKRSLKLKAQVDKLQGQSQDGLVWSQHRERVTEEIQSIVKLLQPLTDFDPKADPPSQSDQLDASLHQLKNVARALALNHTSNGKTNYEKTDEEVSVLQQALRDRDDALEKKKAMETELMKCKTELMMLNNHLLEAVQRRLEMAIELEAWKDDVQTILNHQLLSQQQAEQAQKKPRGFGALRRNKQPSPTPSPSISRSSSPASQAPNTPVAQRWKEKLRRGRVSRLGGDTPEQQASPIPPESSDSNKEDSFQNVSLD
ncbi:bicaudal-D-related protein 2-like [Trichomycterus rosablanca]|uniref:bicaudal-D-related protein 2-like n=1 Tax=Trichomycterus rosablanca TaxID=2290929 RepID=UPI002F35AEFE